MTLDSFDCRRPLSAAEGVWFMSLAEAASAGLGALHRLPYSLRALAENMLRHEDGSTVTAEHVRALVARDTTATVPFTPHRLLMQDASGIPVLADMITLQERADALGIDRSRVAPRRPMDLVVDHSLELDAAGTPEAGTTNLNREFARHTDRFRFLRWAQTQLPGLRVVPPGIGICHQLNLEVLAEVVQVSDRGGYRLAGFDSVVGTDSHTTMINALSVLGCGVGGIEATAAALGQPLVIPVPQVLGVRLVGDLPHGVLATDVALTLTARLRAHGVVQRIVEFHGPALARLSVPDRATIANMAPEYGATMAYFPADDRTVSYLRSTGRPERTVTRVRAFLEAQQMLHSPATPDPHYDDLLELDLSTVKKTVAGPSQPHQANPIGQLSTTAGADPNTKEQGLRNGDVVIAAITSCTNTSNPHAMVTAGLVARNAVMLGLRTAPWTKTSLTPGSRAAAELLSLSGLQSSLDALGFQIAGFGCGTCMGNSGPLPSEIETEIRDRGVHVAAVLSGNRNFTGRIHPLVTRSYLAAPPLVVALALTGRTTIDLDREPLGQDADGTPVFLHDVWPDDQEIDAIVREHEAASLGRSAMLPLVHHQWDTMEYPAGDTYQWEGEPGTIRRPPFADEHLSRPIIDGDVHGARPLLILGDNITTDHISPVARIDPNSEAGRWLAERGVPPHAIGSYSSRRLNHDVMLRGGFANPGLQNDITPELTGAWTRVMPERDLTPVHSAAATYAQRGTPIVIVAGRSYGAGSARDWAAKVTRQLGVRAVIAHSFERIHRTNLVAMGVLPVEWEDTTTLALDGSETIDLLGLNRGIEPNSTVTLVVRRNDNIVHQGPGRCRIDTEVEAAWIRSGGIIPHLLITADTQATDTA